MKQTEIGLIPDDWEVKRLGDVTRIQAGGTPSTLFEAYWNGNIRWMNSGELNLKRVYEVEGRITELGLNNSSTHLIPKGCVLIGLAGQGKTRGTAAINYVDLCTNQSIAAIFPSDFHNSDFLYHVMDNKYQELRELSDGGGGRGGLNLKILNDIQIPLPPLPEQQRIAKALSDVDALISTTEKLLQKKKNIKQGTMQELLTGKKRLPGFAKSNNTKMTELGEIPEDWEVKSVSSLLKIGHGKDYKNLKEGAVPVFGTGGYMTSVNDYLYDGDTVCIGRKGTIDKPFFHTGKIWTVDTLFYTYDFVNCIPKFIYYAFCLVDWLSMNEASGVPSLTSKNIEDVFLCIPSNVSEQTAIVNVLSDMDAEIEKLSAKLQKYHQLKTAMMQQLLTGKIRL